MEMTTSALRTLIAEEWPRIAVVMVAIYKTKTLLQVLRACPIDHRHSVDLSEGNVCKETIHSNELPSQKSTMQSIVLGVENKTKH